MTGKRKRYSADFKAKVALEALKGELTLLILPTGSQLTAPFAPAGASEIETHATYRIERTA
jgi:hypothetical protein